METTTSSGYLKVYDMLWDQMDLYYRSIKKGGKLVKGKVPAFRQQISDANLPKDLKRSLYKTLNNIKKR